MASVSQAGLWKYAPSLGIAVWWEVSGSRGEKKDHSETPARKQVIQGWKRSHAPLLTTALLLQYIFLCFRPACFVFYCVQWNSFDYFPWETITQQPHSTCCQIIFLKFSLDFIPAIYAMLHNSLYFSFKYFPCKRILKICAGCFPSSYLYNLEFLFFSC